ncbi:MAG: YkvA family protein [Leptothrix sp. (in: b-proteobacteria)]
MSDTPYTEPDFWQKIKDFALKAGREVIEKALWLYYAAQRPDTPTWAKTVIYGALAYFISPLDAIPDVTPVIGFVDDLGALAAAVATVSAYINDEVRQQASNKLADWFGR